MTDPSCWGEASVYLEWERSMYNTGIFSLQTTEIPLCGRIQASCIAETIGAAVMMLMRPLLLSKN